MNILSKAEWTKKNVIRWEGIKNCDTKTVERGYLFLRSDDGTITGCGTPATNRGKAIEYHYNLYTLYIQLDGMK